MPARLRLLSASSALLWGLQFAFLSPVLALLLTTLYDARAADVGWVLAVYNAGGLVASLVIPAWADRRREYIRPMLVCAALTIALAAVLALATTLPLAAIALIVLGGPAGVGSTLLFAQLRHSGAGMSEVMNTRAIVSFAWVAGPPVATFVMGILGDRAILPVLGVIGALNVVTTVAMIRRRPSEQTPEPDVVAERQRVKVSAVAVIVVAFVLLQATNSATMSVMTLYTSRGLGLPLLWGGIVLGIAALLEIPALWALGRVGSRVSTGTLLLTGCAAGVAYYAVLVVVREPVGLIAAQLLNAWFFAVVSGVGMTLFQDVIPRPGRATGLFMNTRKIGSIVAGGFIALSAYSYSGMFATCAGLTALAGVTLVVQSRMRRSTQTK